MSRLSVMSASEVAANTEAANYWFQSRLVFVDAAGYLSPSNNRMTPPNVSLERGIRRHLDVPHIILDTLNIEFDERVQPEAVWARMFSDNPAGATVVAEFFEPIISAVNAGRINARHQVQRMRADNLDLLSLATLRSTLRKRTMATIDCVYPSNETCYRTSVDAFLESMWVRKSLGDVLSMEPSWRLPKRINEDIPPSLNKRFDPDTVKPDTISAISIEYRNSYNDLRQSVLTDPRRIHDLLEEANSFLNPTQLMPTTGFKSIDIAGVVIEYKRDQSPKYIRQLAMSMVTTLQHQNGLCLPSPVVFGFLIEGEVANLYAGWMPDQARSDQVNIVGLVGHENETRGSPRFVLTNSFDALRFCCCLHAIHNYMKDTMSVNAKKGLTEFHLDMLKTRAVPTTEWFQIKVKRQQPQNAPQFI